MSYYPPPPPPPPPSGFPPPGFPPPGFPPPNAGGPGYQQAYYPPGYPPNIAARYGWVYASFWQRVGAALIDGLVQTLFILPVAAVGIALVAFNWETEPGTCTDSDGRRYSCTVPTGTTVAWIVLAAGLAILATFLIAIFYWGKYEGQRTQTIGKRTVGIRTVRASTGQPIGFGRAVGRYFAHWISSQVCYLGYLWMLWDTDKQTWHDKIVDSIVVKA